MSFDWAASAYNLQAVWPAAVVEYPRNMLVVDVETTGLEPRDGRIWQVGLYVVRDGQPLPGWERGAAFPLKTPESALLANNYNVEVRTKRRLAAGEPVENAPRIFDEEREAYLAECRDGHDRKEVFTTLASLVRSAATNGWPIVGHNLAGFDLPFIEYEWARLSIPQKFPECCIVDTGILLKAAQLHSRCMEGETPRAFYSRIKDIRAKGVYFSLSVFCAEYWKIPETYGVDMTQAHDAGFDCWLTSVVLHHILEDSRC